MVGQDKAIRQARNCEREKGDGELLETLFLF